MRFFMVAGLLASSVNAAIIARGTGCDATTTTTVTPAPITETQQVYSNVYYTTSTVTRVALESSSSTSPSSAAASSSPAAASTPSTPNKRACNGAQTSTVTAAPSTTTITQTQTRTLAARTTQTVAACQPATNYGLFNGTLAMRSSGGALPSTQTFPSLDSAAQCCNACFTSPDGCMAWSFDGSVSSGEATQGCQMSVMKGGCPAASGTQTNVYRNDEQALVGVGPCLVEQ